MNKLLLAAGISFIGHVMAWFHMQGQFKYEWMKSIWWIVIGGIPISFCFFTEQDGIMNTFKITGMLDQWDLEWRQLFLHF